MDHHKADVRPVAASGAQTEEAARFLCELRQLRSGAGLGYAELAARAHYPYDRIMAAEAGPALPDLPVLSAFVRACGGTTEEWEERWRSLTRSPSLPVPAIRHGGNSDAATAGARINSVTEVADNPDPAIILAALNRVAERMAGGTDTPPAQPEVQPLPDIPSEATVASAAVPASGVPGADSSPAGFPVAASPVAGSPLADSPVTAESQAASAPAAPAETRDAVPWSSDKPTGWDPIRVSAAWPAIGRAPAPSASTAPSADTAAQAGDEAHASSSWIRVAVVAVVLLCVLAVLLAVFA